MQTQQYQLNSKKHHQYQPHSKEGQTEQQANSKKKFYYQLNSKKHHHYQPDPKMYDSQYQKAKVPEAPLSMGWSLPPPLKQKWVQDKDSGCLSKVKDITMELKKLPASLDGGKEPDVNSCTKEDPPPNGISGKLKIVKNKNKNGRIVIVMSKYMENGTQAARIKSGEGNADRMSTENLTEKKKTVPRHGSDHTHKKDAKEKSYEIHASGTVNGQSAPKDSVTDQPVSQSQRAGGKQESSEDQPLQLTTKFSSSPRLFQNQIASQDGTYPENPQKLSVSNKRRHSEPSEDQGGGKRFLSSRSISAPNAVTSPTHSHSMDLTGHQYPSNGHNLNFLDSNPEEPIDLSCVRSREERNGVAKIQSPVPEALEPVSGSTAPPPTSAPTSGPAQEDTSSAFKPFLGNIIITDVTANCLTVTFKEYVTV